jgi:biotin synthase-related radical SAM superfamily protein
MELRNSGTQETERAWVPRGDRNKPFPDSFWEGIHRDNYIILKRIAKAQTDEPADKHGYSAA